MPGTVLEAGRVVNKAARILASGEHGVYRVRQSAKSSPTDSAKRSHGESDAEGSWGRLVCTNERGCYFKRDGGGAD